jgi:glycosyltransferase involved in cell wall biosynthesis
MALASGEKPSVSAVLLSYNCEAFVAAAVNGALAQDYDGPMEIVVSDDASRDRSFAVAEAVLAAYRGPHRVVLRRCPANSGSKSAHLNDVVPACAGELLVSFDGDDVSMPTRVSRIVGRFMANPRAQAVYSSYSLAGQTGAGRRASRVPRPPAGTDSAEWFASVDAYAAGATLAVRRAAFEAFGALDPSLHEDVQLPFRASLLGDVEFIDEPLVLVRRHSASFTADWSRYESLAKYREKSLAGIDVAARVRRSRHSDLDSVLRRMPGERGRRDRVRARIDRTYREAEMTRALLADSAVMRLRGLLALWRAGAYRDELPQHAFLALAPALYLRYRRLRLGLPLQASAAAPKRAIS